ncbi:MAG: DUF2156 domain-containing protein [Porphyromonas sp.]|nr:DUF2156 domain-containing protein [Porphyromonas sp.]
MADLIEFHRVGLEDRDTILAFLEDNPYCNCDYSFGNLYNWGFLYLTSVAFHKGMMVVRFRSKETGSEAYLTPIGNGDLREVLIDMEYTGQVNGHPLILMAVQDSALEAIEQCHPTSIKVFKNRDNADYIYDRNKLETLSGKKLQSKRNHINKFKRLYPDYQYEPLSDANVEECLELERHWLAETEETPGVDDEKVMVTRALTEWKEIGLRGGCIRVEGKVIAFTMGMPINPHCFGVHIEKADTDYEGSFTIINQEFVRHLPERYVRVNREEDLGLEGLRKAKLSYRPLAILEKHKVAVSFE